MAQIIVLLLFFAMLAAVIEWVYSTGLPTRSAARAPALASPAVPTDPAEAERCKVPEFAKAMGHEEMWKLHNNCR